MMISFIVGSYRIEKVHPLEGGLIRRRHRKDRRPTLPVESALAFYPRALADIVLEQVRWIGLSVRIGRIYRKVRSDPDARKYTDDALSPVLDDETETRGMFETAEAQAFIVRERRFADVRAGVA